MMAYSKFEKDYSNAVLNILSNVYGGTEYWGQNSDGVYGVVKPITDEDDPKWSNYNFINSHWTVRDEIINPFLGNPKIEKNKEYTESEANSNYFRLLWKNRKEIFGLDSPLKDRIIEAINTTRKRGAKRESYVTQILKSLPNVDVDVVSKAGGIEDFSGIDLRIISSSDLLKSGTAQVKPFSSLTKNKEYWFLETPLKRRYNTDYMIFGKLNGMEYHVAVFLNNPDKFRFLEDGKLAIPKEDCKLLINYNLISKKSVYKSF